MRVTMDARAIIALVVVIAVLAMGFSFDNLFGKE